MCEKDVIIQTHPCGECVITWDTQEDQNIQTQNNERSSCRQGEEAVGLRSNPNALWESSVVPTRSHVILSTQIKNLANNM